MSALYVANIAEYKVSKSFLAVLCLYVRCMLYPNSKVFIVSGGKEQAAMYMAPITAML